MKIILKEDVPNLGSSGEIVDVKPGYARNYLVPQGYAALATVRNIKEMEHKMRVIKKEIDAAKAAASEVKAKLSNLSLTIAKPAGEKDKLFGSVTNADVSKALATEGIKLDKRRILMGEPIKSLGDHTVTAKLYGGETADVKVWVVKE